MGDGRYTADEKRCNYTSIDNDNNFACAISDRNIALSGYKKILSLLFIFALVLSFRTYVVDRIIVSGESMNPTFSSGDVLWVRKYNIENLSRYQVVIVDVDKGNVIKRIVGLPNEKVQIIGGVVFVNGEILKGKYGTGSQGEYGDIDITLGSDEYFILGDNRDNSMDSRVFGGVGEENIKGVAVFRIFPFWKSGYID